MHPWRERLGRWFTPLARGCPFSPNSITLTALALNVVAAWLLYSRNFLLAILFLAIGGLADAFDGVVARVQGKSTRFGDFLDHFADRLSDLLLISGWLLGNRVRIEITVAVLLVVMLQGYIGTQLEATWRERNYDSIGRGEFVLALVVLPLISHILNANRWQLVAFGGLVIVEWLSIVLLIAAVLGIVQRFLLALRLERTE
ncbi:MAG TPA: CDP-alcohol phosphatidyltransferase family protein [Thermoanaerobaculia bacterium]